MHNASDALLKDARKSLGISQSRGVPVLLIPLAESLISLGSKVNTLVKQGRQQDSRLLIEAIGQKKWKPFNELTK